MHRFSQHTSSTLPGVSLTILLLLVGAAFLPVQAQTVYYSEDDVFVTDSGDLTVSLGRYQIGTAIQIYAHVAGSHAADGGIYHLAGDWNDVPTVQYRSESSISGRLKFYGYQDPNSSSHVYLFATWENQSPNKGMNNTVRLRIKSSAPFNADHTGGSFSQASPLNEVMTINQSENVGIGTTSPDEKLTVNGKVKAKEVVVTQSGWADYVFDPDYVLMPLPALAAFIEKNGHLPRVPTAQTVEANGAHVGETQVMLLEKIEELTLYAIEQHRRAETLRTTVEQLRSELNAQKKKLESILQRLDVAPLHEGEKR